MVHVWTTKRDHTRRWPDKQADEVVRAGGFFVKDSLLAACKAGPFMADLQGVYHAATRAILDAGALIVEEARA